IVQFVFGRKYYINAYKEIFKWRNLGMNTLIALSTGISFIYSFVLMIIKFTIKDSSLNNIDTMYESGAVIITILMIGDLITDKIRKQANKDLSNLEHLQDKIVYVFNNKKIEKKDIKEIKVNEILFVSKGSRIPLDGFLLSKNALINESIITGESKPVVKVKNNHLLSGSINLGDSIKIKVSNLLNDSYLNKVIEKIEELQSQKTKQQKLADKISKIFIPFVLIFSIIGFLIQFFLGNVFHEWYINLDLNYLITWDGPYFPATGYVSLEQVSKSIYLFITVLIIACPCSLGLAVPLAIAVGSSKAMKNSILFNSIDVFEKMKLVNAVAFDKTGTLTTGNFILEKIIGENNLNLIYELESFSLHPLAKSYVNWFLENNKDYKTKKIPWRKQYWTAKIHGLSY
ncbi:MAG: HAD-IC family P-type ATPase, partial [Malacoplasma sp.]|nr:HAD-IC family P-type ATPase [Malacoplasma sp.]